MRSTRLALTKTKVNGRWYFLVTTPNLWGGSKIGRSSLRDATIATGVSVHKVLASQGQSPIGVQVANLVMPTKEERSERHRTHHALDEVTRILQKPKRLDPEDKLMVAGLIASMGKHKDE